MSEIIAVIKDLHPRMKHIIKNSDLAYNILSGQVDSYQIHDEWVKNKIELLVNCGSLTL